MPSSDRKGGEVRSFQRVATHIRVETMLYYPLWVADVLEHLDGELGLVALSAGEPDDEFGNSECLDHPTHLRRLYIQ
jgi:hypothetical protein